MNMWIKCDCGFEGWSKGIDKTIFYCPSCKRKYDSLTYHYNMDKIKN